MNTPLTLSAIAIASLIATALPAQGLLLQVDRDTGTMTLTGTDATAVNLGGYQILSGSGSINHANFDGIRNDVADWALEGTPDKFGVAELLSNAFATTPINDSTSYGLGVAYDYVQAQLDAGLGVDIEQNDLGLSYYDTMLRTTLAGTVEYLGEKQFNSVGVTVDLTAGTAIIENESPFNVTLLGYLVEADTPGSLNTNSTTFDGVRNETGGASFATALTLDGENLGETDVTGVGIPLNSGASYSLGTIGGLLDDLSFSYLVDDGAASRVGFVKYINVPSNLGDFNGDLVVDAADYAVWRNGFPAEYDLDDYADWRANYGNEYAGAAVAGATPTPEPVAAGLLVVVGTLVGGLRSRASSDRA